MTSFEEIANAMQQLVEEQGTPRNVREKMGRMASDLRSDGEARMKADRILAELEELQNDINIPSFVRTQLWSISSMLENLDD